MTAAVAKHLPSADGWRWPIVPAQYDRGHRLTARECDALLGLDVEGLRRLHPSRREASGWTALDRLRRPLDDVTACLQCSGTFHQRRALLDAVAVVLGRCGQERRSFWAWTPADWLALIGHDQAQFRRSVPAWADESARPCLVAHAYLLGGFTDFDALGKFSRAALA
ncbi:hypothetical protein MXD63_32820 [Frankia sp. Cpl3]|uniref:hypothetical protein n=1 Tax=Parafrankia colletiae TaxID=573497 RepID=UPI0018E3EA7D|nr:hypothetical protein [Parafrankia colletiae]MCK9904805.1 hypothetical protein [Frankia sp. Cpl3]